MINHDALAELHQWSPEGVDNSQPIILHGSWSYQDCILEVNFDDSSSITYQYINTLSTRIYGMDGFSPALLPIEASADKAAFLEILWLDLRN